MSSKEDVSEPEDNENNVSSVAEEEATDDGEGRTTTGMETTYEMTSGEEEEEDMGHGNLSFGGEEEDNDISVVFHHEIGEEEEEGPYNLNLKNVKPKQDTPEDLATRTKLKNEWKDIEVLMENSENTQSSNSKLQQPEIADVKEDKFKQEQFEGYGEAFNMTWFTQLNMTEDMKHMLSFRESHLLINETGETIGKVYSISSESNLHGEPVMSVHSGSSAKFNGLECGTAITGFISPEFKTVHELVHEWAKKGDAIIDRKMYLTHEAHGMEGRIVHTKNGELVLDKRFQISAQVKDLITESNSILLQRIIILQKKTGHLDLHTLNENGEIISCNFISLGSGMEKVRGEWKKVWGLRRAVFSTEKVKIWDSLYDFNARLILRCEPEGSHAMIPFRMQPTTTVDVDGNVQDSSLPFLWRCDLELNSKYREKKQLLSSNYKKYLQEHPEVHAILGDFVASTLLVKPNDIFAHARKFFAPFSTRTERTGSIKSASTTQSQPSNNAITPVSNSAGASDQDVLMDDVDIPQETEADFTVGIEMYDEDEEAQETEEFEDMSMNNSRENETILPIDSKEVEEIGSNEAKSNNDEFNNHMPVIEDWTFE